MGVYLRVGVGQIRDVLLRHIFSSGLTSFKLVISNIRLYITHCALYVCMRKLCATERCFLLTF